jgi:hypothetical protein
VALQLYTRHVIKWHALRSPAIDDEQSRNRCWPLAEIVYEESTQRQSRVDPVMFEPTFKTQQVTMRMRMHEVSMAFWSGAGGLFK